MRRWIRLADPSEPAVHKEPFRLYAEGRSGSPELRQFHAELETNGTMKNMEQKHIGWIERQQERRSIMKMDESRHCRSLAWLQHSYTEEGGQAPKSAGSDAGKIKIGVVQIVQHGSLD